MKRAGLHISEMASSQVPETTRHAEMITNNEDSAAQ
jgi:hypothetical protein